MVWGAFSDSGITRLQFYDGHVNAGVYRDTFEQTLIPFLAEKGNLLKKRFSTYS